MISGTPVLPAPGNDYRVVVSDNEELRGRVVQVANGHAYLEFTRRRRPITYRGIPYQVGDRVMLNLARARFFPVGKTKSTQAEMAL